MKSTNLFQSMATLLGLWMLATLPCTADENQTYPVSTPAPIPNPPAYVPNSTSGGVRVGPTSHMTVSGEAIDQPVQHVFHLRNRRGRVFAIESGWSSVPQSGGDLLRIYGIWKDGTLKATNIYYDDGLYGSRAYSEGKRDLVT